MKRLGCKRRCTTAVVCMALCAQLVTAVLLTVGAGAEHDLPPVPPDPLGHEGAECRPSGTGAYGFLCDDTHTLNDTAFKDVMHVIDASLVPVQCGRGWGVQTLAIAIIGVVPGTPAATHTQAEWNKYARDVAQEWTVTREAECGAFLLLIWVPSVRTLGAGQGGPHALQLSDDRMNGILDSTLRTVGVNASTVAVLREATARFMGAYTEQEGSNYMWTVIVCAVGVGAVAVGLGVRNWLRRRRLQRGSDDASRARLPHFDDGTPLLGTYNPTDRRMTHELPSGDLEGESDVFLRNPSVHLGVVDDESRLPPKSDSRRACASLRIDGLVAEECHGHDETLAQLM